MRLDRFYPIVGDADWVARLAPLGIKLVQLRLKDRSEADLRDHIARAKALCERHRVQLVVNDYWRIALDLGCSDIHLGQEDLGQADLAAIRRAGLRLGVSSHDEAELERALSVDPAYIALGPVYPTLLKKMPWAPQGLEKLTRWKARIGTIPLVAIGGLTIPRLEGVFAAGADSTAVVTDILTAPDPETRCRDWLRATRAP